MGFCTLSKLLYEIIKRKGASSNATVPLPSTIVHGQLLAVLPQKPGVSLNTLFCVDPRQKRLSGHLKSVLGLRTPTFCWQKLGLGPADYPWAHCLPSAEDLEF
jgi:hypothetical protein